MAFLEFMPEVLYFPFSLALIKSRHKRNLERTPKQLREEPATEHIEEHLVEQDAVEKAREPKGGKVILHLVRHGEAEHNIPTFPPQAAYDILDPGLTSNGIAQCEQLSRNFPHMDKITYVLSSPLRRALETTKYAFGPIFARGLHVIAYPEMREKDNTPSSTGTPLDLLQRYFRDPVVDFTLLEYGWEYNHERVSAVKDRATRAKEDLFKLGQKTLQGEPMNLAGFGAGPRVNADGNVEILAVAHAGFLAALDGSNQESYHHTEFRSFEFEVEHGPTGEQILELIETKESREKIHFGTNKGSLIGYTMPVGV